MKSGQQLIGHCGVDSGQILLVDPCYVLRDSRYEDKDKGADYKELLDVWEEKGYDHTTHFDFHLGVIVESGWGDGYYPVYARFDGGRLVEVTIDFDPDSDEEEDW